MYYLFKDIIMYIRLSIFIFLVLSFDSKAQSKKDFEGFLVKIVNEYSVEGFKDNERNKTQNPFHCKIENGIMFYSMRNLIGQVELRNLSRAEFVVVRNTDPLMPSMGRLELECRNDLDCLSFTNIENFKKASVENFGIPLSKQFITDELITDMNIIFKKVIIQNGGYFE